MVIEGWMVSVAIAAIAGIATFTAVKSKVEGMSKRQDKIGEKIDEHSELLAAHNIRILQAPTKDFVDNKFVTKELFQQFEKHMEEHFKGITSALKELSQNVKDSNNRRKED